MISQWRVLIIYNITQSYCNFGAEQYLPGELLLKSPCKSEKSQKVNYTSSSSVHHWKLVMFYWRGPLTHVKSSAEQLFQSTGVRWPPRVQKTTLRWSATLQ